jgi:hypothetical protein
VVKIRGLLTAPPTYIVAGTELLTQHATRLAAALADD